jgi:hypothetical protein
MILANGMNKVISTLWINPFRCKQYSYYDDCKNGN